MPTLTTLVTFNVNGLRARLDHVMQVIEEHEPDVLCLQETKVDDKLFPRVPFLEYGYQLSIHGSKGYAGVAIASKAAPRDAQFGFADGPEDTAARIVAVTLGETRVYDLYVPNGTSLDSENFPHKLAWLERLATELEGATRRWPAVVLCGDFNVALDARAVWDEAALAGSTHVTPQERAAMARLLSVGFADCLRKFDESGGRFTWFDYRGGALARGQGMRIDLVLASARARAACTDLRHLDDVRAWDGASDHMPVLARFEGLP
jgi:exodeoxyribonuclease-3